MLSVSQSRKAFRLGRIAFIASLTVAAVGGTGINHAARAQDTIFGFTTGNNLFSFGSATPGTVTNIGSITGVSGILLDIDFRPNNGLLYGLGQNGSLFTLYTISTTTGAATTVTNLTGVAAAAATFYDIDFNPSANALRIVGSNGDNFRVAPAQIGIGLGATLTDTQLSNGTNILGVAYSNNVATLGGTTTLYDISGTGQLFLQGSVNGTPNSPNGGVLTSVGTSSIGNVSELGFDISGVTSTAYVTANNNLYTINLSNGASSAGAAINLAGLSGSVRGISAVTPAAGAPEPGTLALLGTGLVSMGGLAVRRKGKKG